MKLAELQRWAGLIADHDADPSAMRIGGNLLARLAEIRCAICDGPYGLVDAISDDKPVKVCRSCYRYQTGEVS